MDPIVDITIKHAGAYAARYELRLGERLGFGIHGSVHVVEQMTIVTRPFVLDFAGAYVGAPPEFSEDIWAEWEAEKREQFGVRWKAVRTVMSALEDLGIHLVDVSPNNIAFLD